MIRLEHWTRELILSNDKIACFLPLIIHCALVSPAPMQGGGVGEGE